MGTYRVEWDCCGSVTETEAWEPESCPFCTDAAPPAAPLPEPVAWQFRWTNPGNKPDVRPHELEWREVVQTNSMHTIADAVADLRGYSFDGKPCYEVRALYAAPPAAPAPATSADYAMGYAEGFNDACKPAPVVREPLTDEQFADMVAEASLAVDLAANPLKLLAFARAVLSAAPVVREPLTDKQINNIADALLDNGGCTVLTLARAIERAHGIGGGNG